MGFSMLRNSSQECLWLIPELLLGWGGMAGHAGLSQHRCGPQQFFPVNLSAWCCQPLEKREGWAQYCPQSCTEPCKAEPSFQEDRGFNFQLLCCVPRLDPKARPVPRPFLHSPRLWLRWFFRPGAHSPARQRGQKCISSLCRPLAYDWKGRQQRLKFTSSKAENGQ